MIDVQSKVKVYELNGNENDKVPPLLVTSHWNRNEFVVLEMSGVRWTVARRDLEAAMANATNTAKF